MSDTGCDNNEIQVIITGNWRTGKTTLGRLLFEFLEEKGIDVRLVDHGLRMDFNTKEQLDKKLGKTDWEKLDKNKWKIKIISQV